jgi:hypothetical protein
MMILTLKFERKLDVLWNGKQHWFWNFLRPSYETCHKFRHAETTEGQYERSAIYQKTAKKLVICQKSDSFVILCCSGGGMRFLDGNLFAVLLAMLVFRHSWFPRLHRYQTSTQKPVRAHSSIG